MTFLLLRDRSGTVQAVLDPALLKAQPISTESVVKIRGVVKAEPRSRLGFELAAEEIEVLALADQLLFNVNGEELNIPLELALDHRVLSLRHAKTNAVFKIQARWFRHSGFPQQPKLCQVFTPKIVASGWKGH